MMFNIRSHRSFWAYLFMLPVVAFSFCFPAGAQSVNTINIDSVKKALLDDPLFLSRLRDKISVDTVNSDFIRQYLLQNPEILVDMQEALTRKSVSQTQSSDEQVKLIKENEQILYHTANDIVLGNKNTKLAILEFYDYNCGYCKRDFPQLQKFVANNKNVKIIMKDYPILGDDSIQAHLVAHAIKKLDPKKYPAFHEKLMTLQGRATENSALSVAKSLGFNEETVRATMQTPAVQEDMLASARIAYRLGLNYTPIFIIGTRILGAVDVKALPQIVTEEEKRVAPKNGK